jgi:hypothetical protein
VRLAVEAGVRVRADEPGVIDDQRARFPAVGLTIAMREFRNRRGALGAVLEHRYAAPSSFGGNTISVACCHRCCHPWSSTAENPIPERNR